MQKAPLPQKRSRHYYYKLSVHQPTSSSVYSLTTPTRVQSQYIQLQNAPQRQRQPRHYNFTWSVYQSSSSCVYSYKNHPQFLSQRPCHNHQPVFITLHSQLLLLLKQIVFHLSLITPQHSAQLAFPHDSPITTASAEANIQILNNEILLPLCLFTQEQFSAHTPNEPYTSTAHLKQILSQTNCYGLTSPSTSCKRMTTPLNEENNSH